MVGGQRKKVPVHGTFHVQAPSYAAHHSTGIIAERARGKGADAAKCVWPAPSKRVEENAFALHLPNTTHSQHLHKAQGSHPFVQGLSIGCVAHVAGDELVLLDLQCPRQSGGSRTRYYYVHPDQDCQEHKVPKLLKSDTQFWARKMPTDRAWALSSRKQKKAKDTT